ncbi:MAG: hypothetical protein WC511_04345 [Candidatus Pacearchaeota archaeon]|jgi:hypothetical protein
MDKKKKSQEDEKIIDDFLKSKEKMERFIREELEKIKSPIREKLNNSIAC